MRSPRSTVAKKAIFGYAKRNLICHRASCRLNDIPNGQFMACFDKPAPWLGKQLRIGNDFRLITNNLQTDNSMPILRSKRARRGKSAPETSKSPVQDASRFIASPPKNAKEKEEFTRALETGLFQDELDLLGREGGHRRQDTPRRTRESTRSGPFDGVPSKRKMDLTPSPASLRLLKRQK